MAAVPAAARTLAILRLLAGQAAPMSAATISRQLGLARSSTYHLLDTLVQEGFVVHVAEEQRYALGLASYELGSGYSRQAPLQRVARVPLATLVDVAGHNAHLAVLHGREVVYVIEERAKGRAALITDVGVRLPAHLTATGRAMLARLPKEHVRALFPDSAAFAGRTGRGPASYSSLTRALVDTRRRGFSEEVGEVTDGFSSVGVAVVDHSQHPVAAVALTYPTAELAGPEVAALASAATRTATTLSRRLGARI
ncbi:MAG: IclR family transcriptional regulator [Jatrophihabitantaceae bacterium]